jgi:hypothetical protein
MEVPEMRVASPFVGSAAPATPAIDGVEARWAADAIASLARQLPPDSVVGLVLKSTHRELTCLSRSAEADANGVIGPVRIRVAA